MVSFEVIVCCYCDRNVVNISLSPLECNAFLSPSSDRYFPVFVYHSVATTATFRLSSLNLVQDQLDVNVPLNLVSCFR